jgi:hypothetical protein
MRLLLDAIARRRAVCFCSVKAAVSRYHSNTVRDAGRLGVALVFACVAGASVARADDRWNTPFTGVRHLNRVTGSQNLHVLLVDLCAAGVSARGTRPEEAGRTVAAHGAALGAQVVINGDFYNPSNPRQLDGIAMGGGVLWGGADHTYVGPVGFGAGREAIVFHGLTTGAEPWMREVVSGHPTLITEGRRLDNNGDAGLCVTRHPRTALGLTRDRRTLIVAVVDGRAAGRAGMSCDELADLLAEFGAHDATNLDGGGSSAMWLAGRGVVNRPSDGSLRRAGNHLALYARGAGAAPHCPAPRCAPRCDGSVLTGDDCGRGDCAAFGSRCVSDALGARCAFAFCPDTGERDVCWGGSRVGHCVNGALTSQGDCAVYGARCVAEGAAARCVFGNCPATGTRRTCIDDRRIATCVNGAPTDLGDCGVFGSRCVDDALGARCVFAFCPPTGETDVCWLRTHVGHCRDGQLTSQGDCAAFAAFCSTAGGRPARCVSAFCAPDENTAPRASRSCWIEPGAIAACDADGGFALERCPAGQQCAVAGDVACIPAVCPATGETSLCLDDRWLGHCRGGTVAESTDCRGFGGRCVRGPDGARCEVPDAGAPDAPAVDAPTVADVSTGADVAAPDAAAAADLGLVDDDGLRAAPVEGGCGCRAQASPRGGAYMLALGLAWALRRRRRR